MIDAMDAEISPECQLQPGRKICEAISMSGKPRWHSVSDSDSEGTSDQGMGCKDTQVKGDIDSRPVEVDWWIWMMLQGMVVKEDIKRDAHVVAQRNRPQAKDAPR